LERKSRKEEGRWERKRKELVKRVGMRKVRNERGRKSGGSMLKDILERLEKEKRKKTSENKCIQCLNTSDTILII